MIDPRRIWSSSQLPVLPAVAVRLLDASRNPDVPIREVVEIIRSDPVITARILRATEASFFGLRAPVTSLERAVPLLGTTVVTSLTLGFSLVDATMSTGRPAQHYRSHRLRSIVQASAAETLGRQGPEGLDCEYLLGGLLADLGCLAMLRTIASEYVPILQQAEDQERSLHELESERLGIDHIQVSLQLMQNWSLPQPLQRAVRLHHAPLDELLDESAAVDFDLIRAVAVSTAVGDYFYSSNKGPALERLRELTARLYGFSTADLNEYIDRSRAGMERIGELLSIDFSQLGDPAKSTFRASEHFAQRPLREHIQTLRLLPRHEAIHGERQQLPSPRLDGHRQAVRDPLTGLYSRAYLDEHYKKELSRCRRTAGTIGLVLVDLDRFKELNDTHGHQFGDQVLQHVARTLQQAVRSSDVLARYGGEEFVVLAVQPTEKGLAKVAERIRARIKAEEIRSGELRVSVTVSIGTALAIPNRTNEELAARLIAAAEAAMYEAKQSGRNCVRYRSLLGDRDRDLVQRVVQSRLSRWLVNRNVLDISAVSRALIECGGEVQRLGELARQRGWITDEQIERVLQAQAESGLRFGETAVQLGFLSEERLVKLLALQQEDPIALAGVLVRLGLLERRQAAELLVEYASGQAAATASA